MGRNEVTYFTSGIRPSQCLESSTVCPLHLPKFRYASPPTDRPPSIILPVYRVSAAQARSEAVVDLLSTRAPAWSNFLMARESGSRPYRYPPPRDSLENLPRLMAGRSEPSPANRLRESWSATAMVPSPRTASSSGIDSLPAPKTVTDSPWAVKARTRPPARSAT